MPMRLPSLILAITVGIAAPASADTFRFEDRASLDEMHGYIAANMPLGSRREDLRRAFVSEGGAALQVHPTRGTSEKYTYNINLCRIHIWRWNISATYDQGGALTQVFINGEAVHSRGDPPRTPEDTGRDLDQAVIKMGVKPRPQADRGESSITFFLFDTDPASDDIDDEFTAGAGPTRADPANLGRIHAYTDVERWRSIFDDEGDEPLANHPGHCPG